MGQNGKQSRRGGPITERRRVPLGIRITPELREVLVARAELSGRSITQETEALIAQGLIIERLTGDPTMAGKAFGMATEFAAAGRRAARAFGVDPDRWIYDPGCYRAAVGAVVSMLIMEFRGMRPEIDYADLGDWLFTVMPLQPGEPERPPAPAQADAA